MNFNDTSGISSKKYSQAEDAGGYKDMKPSKSVDLTNNAFNGNSQKA